MSESTHRDLEEGSDSEGNNPDGDRIQSVQSIEYLLQPSKRESSFGDSSGPLFSIYSKATKKEDNKMTDRWKADADGILFFTGLFSAATAALLAVTVQDLRPNSQDTSAFYLGNIYEVLADPNATRSSIPSPVARPPPFSPPRYAVWVNSLWFLSLVMSLSCALWATSLQQWARRYIRLTQPERCSPEKRARMRGFFAEGVKKMHIPWAVEGLPALLHLSLFLFFCGLVIFLFNINQEVFSCVIWWIGLFSIVYLLITILPLFWLHSPYYTPLSILARFSYFGTLYVTFEVLASITLYCYSYFGSPNLIRTFQRCFDLMHRYREMLRGVEEIAEQAALEDSMSIDLDILGWTVSALGDDDLLEKFFEAIPGFLNSKTVVYNRRRLPDGISRMFSDVLNGFLDRTLSSNSVTDSVKRHRLDITWSAMNFIQDSDVSSILVTIHGSQDQVLQTVEIGHTVARWCTSDDPRTFHFAHSIVSEYLATVRERDDRWVALAARVYGRSEGDVREIVSHGDDSVSLAILIHFTRAVRLVPWDEKIRFDIRNTLSGLQHDFCTLWNEIVQEAQDLEPYSTLVSILQSIRHLYIALHQGTDAAPTAFSPSTYSFNRILSLPSSYPLCSIDSHRRDYVPVPTQPAHSPDASPHHSTSGDSSLSRQVSVTAGTPSPSYPTKSSEIGGSSQAAAATSPALPVRISPRPTDSSPGTAAGATQDIPPSATLSPLEGATQWDIVAPCAEPDVNEIFSTTSIPGPTPTQAPVPASTSPVLNKLLESYNTGAVSASNPLLPASSGSSIPSSPPPSRVPPSSNTESLTLLSSTTPSRPTGNVTLPRLRARGLVNTGSMCFANAVLQLLVHSPPFLNLFKNLGDLNIQRGAGGPETGGGAIPLVDATVRFFEEFTFKEEPTPMQQPLQQAAMGKPRENEEEKTENKVVDSFEPTYLYDAMKEKRQLKDLLNGQQQDAEEFFRLYLDTLDEELLALLASIGGHKSATAAPRVEEHQVSQSGHTDVGKRGFMIESVESPLMRIFGGKFRSTVRAPNQPDTVTIEDWQSLQLNIQHDSVHTIQDALARISHQQTVQLGLSEAGQQVLVEALPSVLVLHLKRFLYDKATNGIVKISKSVQFAPELEIPLEIMASVSGKSVEPVHYKLHGVLYHHGESAGSGHYTVDVLHPNGDSGGEETWLRIEDETVSAVRHDDVFGGHDNEWMDDRCAYMLFYRRTAPTQT